MAVIFAGWTKSRIDRATAGREEGPFPEPPAASGLLPPEMLYSGGGAGLEVSFDVFVQQLLPVLLADPTVNSYFRFKV